MFRFLIPKIILLFGLLIWNHPLSAQSVWMDVNKERETTKKNLIDMVVTLRNANNEAFSGQLKVHLPKGFRSISGSSIEVYLAPNETRYIPIKVLVQAAAQAGSSEIKIVLENQNQITIQEFILKESIEENNTLRLYSNQPIAYIYNPNDSLELQVGVSNLGNRTQETSLVFSIPTMVGERNFFEVKGRVGVEQDTIFRFKFLPPVNLLERSQFNVNVAGLRGADKELFGNLIINVQNITSAKRFQGIGLAQQSDAFRQNSITASFRSSANGNGMYQIRGAGNVNLSAGYLSLNGNLYQSFHDSNVVLSNTYVGYHYENYQLTIGNINKSMEMALFGRGIQLSGQSKDESKSLEIGFIDQNFNLIERNAFLDRGYAFYTSGTLGEKNETRRTSASYVFKKDVYEKSNSHLLSLDRHFVWGRDWNGNVSLFGGLSTYEINDRSEPSFAVETRYNGGWRGTRLNGNYFFSSGFFPGNRRGMLQIQQNVHRNINDKKMVYGNFFYSDFSPKSYNYLMNLDASNLRLETGMSFMQHKNFSFRLGVQYQAEQSINHGGNGMTEPQELKMKTYRLQQYMTWLSKNSKHSISASFDEGLSSISLEKKVQPQFKLNTTYRFKSLAFNAMYQYGGFYLSEFLNAYYRSNQDKKFQRVTLSLAYEQNVLNNKLLLSSGLSYTADFNIGQTPSAFLNLRYNPAGNWQLYLNSSWYRYDMKQQISQVFVKSNNVVMIEGGVTYNFRGRTPSPGKKATLTALVYYDNNQNGVYDEYDEVATDYLITINDNTFRTDLNGNFYYRSLPFGTYKLKPSAQNGWFSVGQDIRVDQFKTRIEIPLYQSGTVRGQIKYWFDEKASMEVEPQYSGIVFQVSQDGEFIQRISTNEEGEFILFLPTGNYEIQLNESSLPAQTQVEESMRSFSIEAGKITQLPVFEIKVNTKKVNIKKFGS